MVDVHVVENLVYPRYILKRLSLHHPPDLLVHVTDRWSIFLEFALKLRDEIIILLRFFVIAIQRLWFEHNFHLFSCSCSAVDEHLAVLASGLCNNITDVDIDFSSNLAQLDSTTNFGVDLLCRKIVRAFVRSDLLHQLKNILVETKVCLIS